MLVWYEEFADFREEIQREKSLKRYNREWKINLIERTNPHWTDLYPSLPGVAPIPLLVPPRNPGSSAQGRGRQLGARRAAPYVMLGLVPSVEPQTPHTP